MVLYIAKFCPNHDHYNCLKIGYPKIRICLIFGQCWLCIGLHPIIDLPLHCMISLFINVGIPIPSLVFISVYPACISSCRLHISVKSPSSHITMIIVGFLPFLLFTLWSTNKAMTKMVIQFIDSPFVFSLKIVMFH